MKGKRLAIAAIVPLCLAGPALLWHAIRAHAHPGASPNGIVVQQVVCTEASPACVWTYHNDNTRGGVNPHESIITPQNIANLTVLKSVTTDGLIYTQPLYISQISTTAQGTNCGGGTQKRNMVYAATENDSVYGFDDVAGDTNPCWQTSLVPSGETAVPYTLLPGSEVNGVFEACNLLVPQIGITGTPVIDINVNTPLMYVVAQTVDGSGTVHLRLHIIRLLDGKDLESLEVGSTAGLGASFNPAVEQQRPGLALVHNGNTSTVYMSFGAFCDSSRFSGGNSPNPTVGWLISFTFDYTSGLTPVSTSAFQTEMPVEVGTLASLWGGGAAPAIDSTSGTVFVLTANGYFNGSGEWGDTILQLHSGLANSIDDYYTPNDYYLLEKGGNVCLQSSCTPSQQVALTEDMDFGSGGIVLLSTKSLALNNPELIAAGKEGMIYVTAYHTGDPASGYNGVMGGLDGTSCGYSNPGCKENPAATDCTTGTTPAPGTIPQCWEGFSFLASREDQNGSRGSPAFIDGSMNNNYLYIAGVYDNLRAFSFTASSGVGTFNTTPIQPASPAHQFIYPGATPSITWDGSNFSNAIVWTVDTSGFGNIVYDSNEMPVSHRATNHASIYAYAAQPSGGALTLLWSDTSHGPASVKFVPPTIANGMVFVAGGNNNPFYDPGTTTGTTNCTLTPTNCGELVIWH
jgi:hypothetical protein